MSDDLINCLNMLLSVMQIDPRPRATITAARDALEAAQQRIAELEQQLTNCSIAARGGTDDPKVCGPVRGQQGWSPAYADVFALRTRFEIAQSRIETLEQQSEDNYTQGRKAGLREALENVYRYGTTSNCSCHIAIQALIDAATEQA